jgi:hypothetical protein
VEQSTTGTTPIAAATQVSGDGQSTVAGTTDPVDPGRPVGFGARGRMRRRARFLRKARELAYRDLGGLVFNLHRFGQRNDTLVIAKLSTLSHIDGELRTLETALQERQAVTIMREAGIAACPRCAAIHGSDDRFCPNCGLAMDRHAERPVGAPTAAPAASGPATASTPTPSPAPTSAPTPAPTSASAHADASATAASQANAPAPRPAPPAARPSTPDASVERASTSPADPAPSPASDADRPTEIVRPPDPGA